MVPLNRLPKGNVLDEWYPLLSPSHSKMEVGSIRVRSKFTVRNLPSAIRKLFLNLAETERRISPKIGTLNFKGVYQEPELISQK